MVKNTMGGTGTKSLARKHISSNESGGTIRLPSGPLEQIVIVTKMLGNGMCEVFNNEDVRFIAHIRAKFKGRNRRSNDISLNSFILVGIRDWEKPFKNVDVIFVYDHFHVSSFHSYPSLRIDKLFNRTFPSNNNNISTTHDFDFLSTHDISFNHHDLKPTLSITDHDISLISIHDIWFLHFMHFH